MLSQKTKTEIELYHRQIRRENSMFVGARSGRLQANQVAFYLKSLEYLVAHTPKHLALAAQSALDHGLSELNLFFKDKIKEEAGHNQWAESDLERLCQQKDLQKEPIPVSATIEELLRKIETYIKKCPSAYLSYIFFTEYFTVIATSEFVSDLATHCSIPESVMSILTNHEELDKNHIEDDIREIDAYVGAEDQAAYFDLLHEAMKLFNKFWDEVGRGTYESRQYTSAKSVADMPSI